MWPAALTRLLRRRLLYIILAILGIVYFFNNIFGKNGAFSSLDDEDDDLPVLRRQPLIWRTHHDDVIPEALIKESFDPTLPCRNSIQGREWLTDDRGFLCRREHILPSGCCNVDEPETEYYTCATCNSSSHCCGVYERCVSCCLHPAKRAILELAIRTITGRQALVYAAVKDHFELCLVKCRTNSHSVEHENKYRNPSAKFCYGPTEAHESQREVAGGDGPKGA